ncbi:hypothetical protein FB107DRAFT_271222 [Schizophyllum commune]
MPPESRLAKNRRKQRSYSPVLNRFKSETTFTVEEALGLEQQIRKVKKKGHTVFTCPYAGCNYIGNQKESTISHLHSIHTKFCYYICPASECTFMCSNHASISRHCGRMHNCKAPPKSIPNIGPLASQAFTLMGTTAADEGGSSAASAPNTHADMPNVPTGPSHFGSSPSAAPPPPTFSFSPWASTSTSSSSPSSSTKSRKRRAFSTVAPPIITTSISRRSVSAASLAAARSPMHSLTPPAQSSVPSVQHVHPSTPLTTWTPPMMAHQGSYLPAQAPYLPTDAMAYDQQFNASYGQPADAAYGQHPNGQPVDTAYDQPMNACNTQSVSYSQHFDGLANQCMDQAYNSNEAADYDGAINDFLDTVDVQLDETTDSYGQHADTLNYLDQQAHNYISQPTNINKQPTTTHTHEPTYLTYPPSPASSRAANVPQAGHQSSSVSPVSTSTSLPTPPISMPVPSIPAFDAVNAMPRMSPMPVPFLPLPNTSTSTFDAVSPMRNTSTSLPASTSLYMSDAPLNTPAVGLPFDPRQCSRQFLFDFCNYVFKKPVPEQWPNALQLWQELHSDEFYPQSSAAFQPSNATCPQPHDTRETEAALREFVDSTKQFYNKIQQEHVPLYASSSNSSRSCDGSFPFQPSNGSYGLQNDVPYDPTLDPAFAYVDPDFLFSFWVRSVQPVYRWLRDRNALPRHLTEQDLLKFMLANN